MGSSGIYNSDKGVGKESGSVRPHPHSYTPLPREIEKGKVTSMLTEITKWNYFYYNNTLFY
jgi:hypothetical protein